MEGIDKLAKGIGKAVETVPELYEDGMKPATVEGGEVLALIPRTIKAALAPLRQWIAQREYNVAETEKLLAIKLENIEAEKIVSPEGYVAVPAIQAISYCLNSDELRNMYANLLAKSMVSDTKNGVHPAYVEIIKQLSPDEAKLLKHISTEDKGYPLIDIKIVNSEGGFHTVMHHFTDIAEGVCEEPENTLSYLDNLERMRLIDVPWGLYIGDDSEYEKILQHPKVLSVLNFQTPEGWTFETKKEKFEITQFGRDFINVCIKEFEEV